MKNHKEREGGPIDNRKRFLRSKEAGVAVIAFLVGIFSVLIYQSVKGQGELVLSATTLLSFMFSSVLSVVSIVLAITAIGLGKSSEENMIRRSDVGIDLQNQAFLKTINTLKDVELVVGTTKSRIEDLIAGRVGSISENVVKTAIEEDVIPKEKKVAFEKDLRRFIIDELKKSSLGYIDQ